MSADPDLVALCASRTAAEINALPERMRTYIRDLETQADPAGTIRENWDLRDQRDALALRVVELSQHVRDLGGEP